MHILKIIHGYPPLYNAGSEVYSQSICNELSKRHRVSVCSREENPYKPCFSIRKQQLHEQLALYLINNPQDKDGYRHRQLDANFGALLDELAPDIAHIGHLNHLSTGMVAELKKRQIPIVFTLHDFWLMCPRGQFLTRSIGCENNFRLCSKQDDGKCARDCYQVYFSGIDDYYEQDLARWTAWVGQRMEQSRALVQDVDLFIAPSQYLRQRFIRDFGLAEEQILYLDYGFPTHYLQASQEGSEKQLYSFGYIGTHIPAKGVNLLIEAFGQLKEPARLIIWGDKDKQSSAALRQLAEHSPNPVEFRGAYINKNLANEVFSQVHAIVVPSIWGENSPLVIHEAQACKIPVITANFGGMREYVQHQHNGLLFEHRSASSLYEQLLFALQNPELLKSYGQRGYLYSPDGSVPDIVEHCRVLESIYRRFIE